MKLLKHVLFTAITLSLSTTVVAESLAEQIKKRAAATAEIKALLSDPDQNTRIAALDVMLKSGDTSMRELAYTIGFNSAEDTFRAIALRNKFNELKSLTVYFDLPESPTDKQKKTYEGWSGSLIMGINSYDEATGTIKSSDQFNYKTGNGSISGLSVNFKTNYCGGTLILNEESVLEGEITCEKTKFLAKANII